MKAFNKKILINILILVVYLIIRVFVDSIWDSLPIFAPYLFDLIYFSSCFYLYKSNWNFSKQVSRNEKLEITLSFLLGFITLYSGELLGFSPPFEFHSFTVALLLIFIGPILEELIFRFSFVSALKNMHGNKYFLMITSAILFSLAHYWSIFSIPQQFKGFVYYQTFYTLIIGLWWGYNYLKYNNMFNSVFLHIAFNFGFYLGGIF